MSNYMQPDYRHGAYDPSRVYTSCPLCDRSNVATARNVGSNSFEWRCDNGHRFTMPWNQPPTPFLPVFDELCAENRMLLTDLQKWRG